MKPINKLTAISITTFILLTGCSANNSNSQNIDDNEKKSEEKTESQTIVSPADVEFEEHEFGNTIFQIPNDWKILDDESETIQFYAPKSNDIIQLTMVDAEVDSTGIEQTVFESAEKAMMDGLDAEVSKEDITIGGHPGRILQFEQTANSGKLFKCNAYIFINKNYYYTFVIAVDDSSKISYRPIYSYIIDSIKFLDEEDSNPSEDTTSSSQESTATDDSQSDTSTKDSKSTDSSTASKEYKNALKSAKSYLSYSAFSYSGLIHQLEFEGYPTDAATYAVDNCGANWKEQALKSAKSYLSYSSFSYSGLIHQLEFEGFTTEEATYGADKCGADWNEQAYKSAQSYLKYSSYSRSGLIEQLVFEGFTNEQAEYGVSKAGL